VESRVLRARRAGSAGGGAGAVTIREPARGRLDEAAPADTRADQPRAINHAGATTRATLKDTLKFSRVQPALLHTWLGATVFTLWAWD